MQLTHVCNSHITFIQRRESIESSIILLYGLPEVVCRQTVLTQLIVDTANVVKAECCETLSRLCNHGRLLCGAEHL